jgi:hypothetical protein
MPDYKNNGEFGWEEREHYRFTILGLIFGSGPMISTNKVGFGLCDRCEYAEIGGDKEPHPEGLGDIIIGLDVECSEKHPFPKGMIFAQGHIEAEERCKYFIPKACEICYALGHNEKLDCESCAWREE